MILVDTSIWIEMFRKGKFIAELGGLIGSDQICTHPFVVAELACGALPERQQTLLELEKLHALPTIRTEDVRSMIETRGLFSKEIGFVDAQLIASCLSRGGNANLDDRSASRRSRGITRSSRDPRVTPFAIAVEVGRPFAFRPKKVRFKRTMRVMVLPARLALRLERRTRG